MARQRRFGPRGKSGRLLDRTSVRPAILAETLRQRAGLVGTEAAAREEAATSLGRLLLAGRIERAHYDAALLLLAAWRRWVALAEMPSRSPRAVHLGEVAGRGSRPEVSDEDWRRARERYLGAIAAVGPGLPWATVESLVIDDIAPSRLFESGGAVQSVYVAMIAGLDALADYFGTGGEGGNSVR